MWQRLMHAKCNRRRLPLDARLNNLKSYVVDSFLSFLASLFSLYLHNRNEILLTLQPET